jgi:spore coat protein U-like protein
MYRNTDINSKGVKTMRSLKMAAMALALAAPGMAMAATDGTLGATSTGTMNVSLTVTPNTDNYVQILGLEDFIFPSSLAGTVGALGQTNQYICLNKNTLGTVNLDIVSSNPGNFTPDSLYIAELADGTNRVPYFMALQAPDGVRVVGNGQSWSNTAATPSACTAASGNGVAYRLYGGIESVSPIVAGTYSNTFTLTLSPN